MKNISNNLKLIAKIKNKLFPFYKKKEVKELFKIINKGEPKDQKNVMFVGGCVRKYLSNDEIDDIDIATSLTPDQLKEKFNEANIKSFDTGLEHGSITVIVDKIKFEITTLRKDIKTDGRHAEIEFTDSWKDDSDRRDFTINAIYLDEKGKLFDPQLGAKDLENGVVKFIGDPEKRIEEDYLRIIRFIRFVIQYESKVEKSTLNSILTKLDGIGKLSKERVLKELMKIINLENFKFINNYENLLKLFNLIFPELKYYSRFIKFIEKKEYLNLNQISSLAILLIDGSNNHEYFCHKYKTSNFIKDELNKINNRLLEIRKDKNFFNKSLKKTLYNFDIDVLYAASLVDLLDKKKPDFKKFMDISSKIKKTNKPIFPYDGKYLIKRGFSEGKNLGKVLKQLEDLWIKNNFSLSNEDIDLLIKKNKEISL